MSRSSSRPSLPYETPPRPMPRAGAFPMLPAARFRRKPSRPPSFHSAKWTIPNTTGLSVSTAKDLRQV
ncbi:uncharacterized protein M6B38_120425 [Iris pallida]|uniref:Uncharacterized protein n=1 Tax=Iris pallida TaxID=29817 RepID=A0AAX6HAR6_IRIPA|nr:uncharacterized protein M6B38_347965 [Iris pallida]KAJ6837687.1 uncharacterized protein M6B38_120425 [Iris pallida]